MDKNIIKKFAIESRSELIERVTNKINKFYVNEEFNVQQNGDVFILSNNFHSISLTKREYENRILLLKRISEISLKQVVEEAAFTWFNRIVAIRYMEIHDYLPLTKDNQSLGIRVLSSKDNTPDPEIMKISNLINPELDIGFNKEYYSTILDNNKRFEYILLLVCRKLGNVIPQVFDGITDYIDILIPDNLLNDSGYITKILKELKEDSFNDVEIIGWLYQYYNQAEKDKIMSQKTAYTKEQIPFATQLFTPDWIVKYMVENSLGRLWIENGGNKDLICNWKYYIKNENGNHKNLFRLEEIKCFDPCSGSGHILVYMFEVLYQIYLSEGYTKSSIAENILKNNLYGLDIDDRACQLSILAVILKAREYDKNIFNKNIIKQLNIMSINESNLINTNDFKILENENDIIKILLNNVYNDFYNAKEIGSLLLPQDTVENYEKLLALINEKENSNYDIIELSSITELKNKLKPILLNAKILKQKYDVIVTNPPYLPAGKMNANLKNYVNKFYSNGKTDLCTAFMQLENIKENGYLAMINQHSWMFLGSYENLRAEIINEKELIDMIHLGTKAFEEIGGEVVQTTTFVLNNQKKNTESIFFDLKNVENAELKEKMFLEKKHNNEYIKNNINNFVKIPGNIFSYWMSQKLMDTFKNGKILKTIGDTRQGMATSDNNRFLRFWFEIDYNRIGFNHKNSEEAKKSGKKWFPYNKGGSYRKWYGNIDYVINYENDGYEVKKYASDLYKTPSRTIKSMTEYFKDSISWSKISTNNIALRYYPNGFIFDVAGCCIFTNDYETKLIIMSFLNSKVAQELLKAISPTLNFEAGQIATLPIIMPDNKKLIYDKVNQNITLSKKEWDMYEQSWDFEMHPFIKIKKENNTDTICIEDIFIQHSKVISEYIKTIKENEEIINKEFINTYDLASEINYSIDEKDITIRKADREREIKSLISYAVGCMFGRYSLDKKGIIHANTLNDYNIGSSFQIDKDNIIPITEGVYFEDDIVTKFFEFIKVAFGSENFYKNIEYIAETIGKRNGESDKETIKRYFLNDFYNDHLKLYQKHPIYWLFDSGKKNGFKCLIYMHRYSKGTVSKIRLDYLHKMQNTYEKELEEIERKLSEDISLLDKKELTKKQVDLNAKLQETKEYDEKIAHIADQAIEIDLDDGVTVNYAKFSVKNPKTGKEESILAKIK